MEFPAGAITNLNVIDDLANLHCRLYYTNSLIPCSHGSIFKDEPLVRPGNLEVTVLTLRNLGCLVSTALGGRGLWIFSGDRDFEPLRGLSVNSGDPSRSVIDIDGFKLSNCVSGTTHISEVIKRFLSDPHSNLLQTQAFQILVADDEFPVGALQHMTTSSSIYKAFVSAVSGLLTLRATLNYGAIPLGKRTVFTTTDLDGYEDRDSLSSSIGLTPFLSTLNLDITTRGRLIVSWRSIPQYCLERLSPRTMLNGVTSMLLFNEDLWLAPTGTVCRYMSVIRDHPSLPLSRIHDWKLAVGTWLQKFGLDLDESQEDVWIEVEVVNPLSSEGNSMNVDESGRDLSSSTSRILWPAIYCFRRAKSEHSSSGTEFFPTELDTPLGFAERWMADSVSRKVSAAPNKPAQPEAQSEESQHKLASPAATKGGSPRLIESLARTIHYPDANIFNAVYPTPPGGTIGPNSGVVAASEGLDSVASYVLNASGEDQTAYPAEDIPSASFRRDSEAVLGDLDVPPSQLGIGSGMYDTTADNDLFDDMDEDFGTKGITEADFNFFDEPDIAGLEETGSGMQQLVSEEGPTAVADPESISDQGNKLAISFPGTSEPKMHSGGYQDGVANPTAQSNLASDHPVPTSNVASYPIRQAESRPMSPPLSPSRIRAILSNQGLSSTEQNQVLHGRYEPIPFRRDVGSSDQKYKQAGRFWFSAEQESQNRETKSRPYPADIPLLGLPPKKAPGLHESSHRYNELALWDGMDSGQRSPSGSSDRSSDNESQPSISMSNASTPPPRRTGEKRKRSFADTEEPQSPSLRVATDLEIGLMPANYSSFVGGLIFQSTDWSLAGYFSRKQPDIAPVLTQTAELTQVAQLLVDQTTQSCFLHGMDGMDRPDLDAEDVNMPYHSMGATELLDKGQKLGLRAYLTMEDTVNASGKRQDGPPQARPNTMGGIFKLNPPHVRIHRGDSYLEALPAAVPFWETFGLEPLHGQKDILSYCIYPHTIKDDADTFLERLGATYSSASFGKHSRPDNGAGLIPWTLNSNGDRDYGSIMSNLQHICENLGTELSNLPQSDQNAVVYILNPFSHGAALADICSAFIRLFKKYVEDASRRHRQFHELVLQTIPLRFVTSLDSLVVPPQLDYLRLSLEVYSRCAPKGYNVDWTGCAPAVVLAEPVPRGVSFKLSSDSISPLEEGRCFHIAYSLSVDQRWATVAWTDSAGRYQMNMSYCLRERGSSVYRPVIEVMTDIWGATQDILGMTQRQWRVMIAKNEPLEPEEITAWTTLVQKHNQAKPAKVELSILSVDIDPGLLLKIPPSQAQMNSFSQQIVQPSQGNPTPVSTPKPGVPSPDPSSSASTPYPISNLQTPTEQQQSQSQHHPPSPGPEQDQTILIDKSDETWATVLSHRLNSSNTLSTYRPAQASGYLLRRRGTSDTEGLASLAVNVIYFQARVPVDVLLKDVLRMYRDLAALSRTRGIAHAQGHCPLPWHIATAVKGQEALSYIL